MEPTSAPSIERALGRVEGRLDAMMESLREHTDTDAANFASLSEKLDALDVKLDGIDVHATVRRIAWKYAAAVGGVVVFLAQVAQALGLL